MLYHIPAFFITLLRCSPIRKNWEPAIPGHCITSVEAIFLADAISGLVTDLMILLLPVPLIWQLQIHWKNKLQITLIFAGGTL